jgi:PAS domain S-box-containing protein
VDDEEQILELLRSFLEQRGMRVVTAENAEQALSLPDLAQVQVALLDIRLPGTNGHALQQELNLRFPDMAKILMSGQADLDDVISAYSDQAYSFIKKPFSSLKEIAVLIERAAQNKALETQNRSYIQRLEESSSALKAKTDEANGGEQRLHRILAHFYAAGSQMAHIESPDTLLDFVCRSLVEAQAFARAVILVADEKYRVRDVGAWQADGMMQPLVETLRALRGQPLRPYEFDRSERPLGIATHTRPCWRNPGAENGREDDWREGDQLIVPLLHDDETVFGYLTAESPPENALPSLDLVHLIQTFLMHCAHNLETQSAHRILLRRADEAEALERERVAQLRASDERFNRLVSVVSDVVFITDELDRFTFLSESFTRVLGYIRENYIGRTLQHLLEEIGTESSDNRRAMDDLTSSARDHAIHQVEVLTRAGDKRMLEISRTVVRQGGAVKGSQGLVRDITEQRALLQRLFVSERLATTGKIAAGVAHEINNPLQAMLSQIKSAEQKLADAKSPGENLALLMESIERLRFIVNSMLDLNRTSPLERMPVDLNALVRKVMALVQHQARQYNVQVRLDLSDTLPPVSGSSQELLQVILNLVLNAIEAMPKGGDLRISSVARLDRVELIVADSGVGIASENLPRIFEPFFTMRESGSGTGLGLYLTKNIVQMHGGSISVESEPSRGSRFIVTLPTT